MSEPLLCRVEKTLPSFPPGSCRLFDNRFSSPGGKREGRKHFFYFAPTRLGLELWIRTGEESGQGRRTINQPTYWWGSISMMDMPVSVSPFMIACATGEAPRQRGSMLPCTFRTPLKVRQRLKRGLGNLKWKLPTWERIVSVSRESTSRTRPQYRGRTLPRQSSWGQAAIPQARSRSPAKTSLPPKRAFSCAGDRRTSGIWC